MIVGARNDLADPVLPWPDDVLDAISFVVPLASRSSLLPNEHGFVTAPVMPAHPHRAFVPHHHLLEVERAIHPQGPSRELRIRTAAAAAAAAAAATSVPEPARRLFEEPLSKLARFRAVVRNRTGI